jgi:hypothetical protein
MDPLRERLNALESQVHTLTQHTRSTQRRLRWWRGLACGAIGLAVLTWVLPAGTGQQEPPDGKGLAQRVAALESLLKPFSREKNEIFITGANLHIVNGLGSTDCFNVPDCPNGLGNLIVGYNKLRVSVPEGPEVENIRTGSHNVVVGREHNFSSVGGMVIGRINEISAPFASIITGQENKASGFASSISGGYLNEALGSFAAVSGGAANRASGDESKVSGGSGHLASGLSASVCGGDGNVAGGDKSSVSGGTSNTASGNFAVVSGGGGNTAGGDLSSVSGGQNITQETAFGWLAGSEADEDVVGNFRSP